MAFESAFCSTIQSGTSIFPILSSLNPFRRQEIARVTITESKFGLLSECQHFTNFQTFISQSWNTLKEMKASPMNCISICQPMSICTRVNFAFHKSSAQLSPWHCPTVTPASQNHLHIQGHRWHPSWHSLKAFRSSPPALGFQALCKDTSAVPTLLKTWPQVWTVPSLKLKLQLSAALPLLLPKKLHEALCTNIRYQSTASREQDTFCVFQEHLL